MKTSTNAPPATRGRMGTSLPRRAGGRRGAVLGRLRDFGEANCSRNKIQPSFLVLPAALARPDGARTHGEEKTPLLRDYEILYIVRPDLDEEQLKAVVDTVGKLIENLGGAVGKTAVWCRQRLADEV